MRRDRHIMLNVALFAGTAASLAVARSLEQAVEPLVEPIPDREPVTGKRQFAENRQQRRARERAERKIRR